MNDLYQLKCCAKCIYIRPYGGYKVCSYPFFPAEMSILDISSFKVNPDAIPDWCPLKKINDQIASMPEEKRNAFDEICKGLGTLLGMSDITDEEVAVPVQKREMYHLSFFACGSCGTVITDGDRFCRMCGKKVKWDDSDN